MCDLDTDLCWQQGFELYHVAGCDVAELPVIVKLLVERIVDRETKPLSFRGPSGILMSDQRSRSLCAGGEQRLRRGRLNNLNDDAKSLGSRNRRC